MTWIPLLLLLTPYPWRLLGWVLDARRPHPKHVEPWPQKRARLAFENRCEDLGARHFEHYNRERSHDDRL